MPVHRDPHCAIGDPVEFRTTTFVSVVLPVAGRCDDNNDSIVVRQRWHAVPWHREKTHSGVEPPIDAWLMGLVSDQPPRLEPNVADVRWGCPAHTAARRPFPRRFDSPRGSVVSSRLLFVFAR